MNSRASEPAARRKNTPASSEQPCRVSLSTTGNIAFVDGKTVRLKPQEHLLMAYLAETPGELVPYHALRQRLWPDSPVSLEKMNAALRALIYGARKKIPAAAIKTTWGSGL